MTVERFQKYAQRECIAIGLEEGREEGLIEGIQQKALETAKIALSKNLSTEMIQELTGLTIQQINELK